MPSFPRTRRSFLRDLTLAATAAPFFGRTLLAQTPAVKIRHATFGTSGMGWADVTALASHPAVEVVAGCDVDERSTKKFRERFPDARIYSDYRQLLEKEKDLQTVNVSTPDHMHAPIGMAALQRGLHVYGQKPLTHDIYESRRLTEVARERQLVTQMGIQIQSGREYRTAVKLIQSGAIGKVKEVHAWSSKEWGGTGVEQLPPVAEVPEGLNWDLWLGVCQARPFLGGGWYHPGQWRRRLDFGTGTFGDMGCHIYDPVFKALALTAPLTVRSEGAAPGEHSWATDAVIHYVFPGTEFTEGGPIKITWYDGRSLPSEEIRALAEQKESADQKEMKFPDQGSIFVGTKGAMILPHVSMPRLVGEAAGMKIEPEKGTDHYHQFIDAVLGGSKPGANFDYSGPLTEAVLLGSVASRFPKETLELDAASLSFTNVAAANQYIRRAYRPGWETAGL